MHLRRPQQIHSCATNVVVSATPGERLWKEGRKEGREEGLCATEGRRRKRRTTKKYKMRAGWRGRRAVRWSAGRGRAAVTIRKTTTTTNGIFGPWMSYARAFAQWTAGTRLPLFPSSLFRMKKAAERAAALGESGIPGLGTS